MELEKQNYAFKSSVEQHLSVIQQQEMIINAQDEERVKRKKEKERRSRELPVKEKSKNMLELVAPSQVYACAPTISSYVSFSQRGATLP